MTTPDPIQPLSDAELSALTGVKMRHRKLPAEKVVEVLSRARIWHWLGDDGRVITTRHHVCNAGAEQPERQRFEKAHLERVR